MKASKDVSKASPQAKKKSNSMIVSKMKKDNIVSKELSSPISNSENISPILRPRRSGQKTEVEKKLSPPKQKSVSIVRNHRKNKYAVSSMANSSIDSNIADKSRENNLTIESSSSNINKEINDDSIQQVDTNQETSNDIDEINLRPGKKITQSIFDTPTSKNDSIATAAIKNSEATESTVNDLSEDQMVENMTLKNTNVIEEAASKGKINVENGKEFVDEKELIESTTVQLDVELQVLESKTEISNVHSPLTENSHDHKDVIVLDNAITIANIKSPSTVSIDSAKGSSIGNDSECTNFVTGDLYWGRIHAFSYWACMVSPDESSDDNPITRLVDQKIEVHVLFFADNARHSWVKRENLMPYLGLESYRESLREFKDKFGEKKYQNQTFLPKKAKLKTWLEAAKEADEVAKVPYSERLKKFFQLNNIARERNKEERIRRKSMSLSRSFVEKLNDDNDENETAKPIMPIESISKKRNRSESPVSPTVSPIRKPKRRKTTADISELMKNQQTQAQPKQEMQESKNDLSFSISEIEDNTSFERRTSLLNSDLFRTPTFKDFHEIMKEFVMKGAENDYVERNLCIAVKNIWDLKNMLQEQLSEQIEDNSPQSFKRLSIRLKNLKQRQKLQTSSTPTSPNQTMEIEKSHLRNTEKIKPTKVINRPLTEVIDDIFNLDSRYLFDNMGRDPVCKYCFSSGGNLIRCSKNCLSWFHSECLKSLLEKGVLETGQKKKRSLSKRRSKSNSNQNPNQDQISSTAIETTNVVKTMVHVTADSFENQQPLTKLNSEAEETKINDSNENEQVELADSNVCKECANGEKPKCFVCHSSKEEKTTPNTINDKIIYEKMITCNVTNCIKVYHPSCLKYWPQAKITKSKDSIVSLRCPSHICHTCVSDDPKGKFQNLNNAQTTKCVKCPATYHMDSTCIPAGSKILSAAHIICPRHAVSKSDQNVNVCWCFICVSGGQLICCETCPTAVHAECSNVALDPNESYICDECESGRLPLYGEMVWAKFTTYRWWPAIILPPTEVPLNIRNKVHSTHDFVIRFFGTHDHGWISRRRVYLYVEGDWSEPPQSKKICEKHYLRGVIEAKEVYEIIKAKNLKRLSERVNKEKLHPQPYVKIKMNRAVAPVKLHIDLEKVNKCECNPNDENPCGPETNCLNRVLYHECNPKICPAGKRCQNQMFESRISPALEIFYTKKERGFGLRSTELITAGSFVIEYVGEIIDSDEFQRRIQQKSADRDENYYFLSVEKDYIIDAGPKGNMARFMNHSCDPNCETQKWSVNGLNRVGLFAIKDIPANTELTFNYHWDELLGRDKKVCYCGSQNCIGLIGKISKDPKLKQLTTDGSMSDANGTLSITEQPKTSKLVRNSKNMPMKSTQPIQSRNRIAKKSRIGNKKNSVTNTATISSIENDIKNVESNDKNNNV